LLNLETEQYFGLDETGTRMWQLVTVHRILTRAYQELLAEFDVEPELLRSNLMDLLSRLVDSGCSKFFLLMWERLRRLARWSAPRRLFFCARSCCCHWWPSVCVGAVFEPRKQHCNYPLRMPGRNVTPLL